MKIIQKLREIALYYGDDKIYVSDEDFKKLSEFNWHEDYFGDSVKIIAYSDHCNYYVNDYDGYHSILVIQKTTPPDLFPYSL